MIKALIVTHASATIGGGHVGRCTALASAFRVKGVLVSWLVNREAIPFLPVVTENIFIVPDPFDINSLPPVNCDVIVVDSYVASIPFLKALSSKGVLVLIDDNNTRDLWALADILINYNFFAGDLRYPCAACHYILGPHYALLKEVYWNLLPSSGGGSLFVAGGADVCDATSKIVQWWLPTWGKLTAVMGQGTTSQQREEVQIRALEKKDSIDIVFAPPNFENYLASADLVICTSSVVAYEALALEKRIIVFQVAENQIKLGLFLQQENYVLNLGLWDSWGLRDMESALFSPFAQKRSAVNKRGALASVDSILAFCRANERLLPS